MRKAACRLLCLTDFDIVIHLNYQFNRIDKGGIEQVRIIKYRLQLLPPCHDTAINGLVCFHLCGGHLGSIDGC